MTLGFLAHREAALPGDERHRERDGHRADCEPTDCVELDPAERFDDRVADDLDAVAAERHLAAVEVPVRGTAGGQGELAFLDRVLAERRRERGLGGLHRAGLNGSASVERSDASQQRAEEHDPVGGAEHRVARPLGVRHEARRRCRPRCAIPAMSSRLPFGFST